LGRHCGTGRRTEHGADRSTTAAAEGTAEDRTAHAADNGAADRVLRCRLPRRYQGREGKQGYQSQSFHSLFLRRW
jgi:hypothetical protein